MSDKQGALTILERLRERIEFLQTKQSIDGDFLQWYLAVIETLSNIFGVDSDELMEFNRISFEIDQNFLSRVRELLDLPSNISIQQSSYYHHRLTEASEFLTTMIFKLRQG